MTSMAARMADTGPSVPPLPSDPHALRVRLAEIDGEMAELRARIEQLARARLPIANALESIVYPIVTLPTEITIEIFLHYVTDPLRLPDSYTDLSGPPLLASICRVWRHIALNLQVIWSNIAVDLSVTEPLLQCCLARAGGNLLTLDMNSGWGENPKHLFAAAAQYCMQWETFKCRLDLSLAFPMDQVEGRFLRLRKLALTAYYNVQTGFGTTAPVTAFCEAPLLREVELDEISLPSITLPWAQLTHLTCSRIDAAQIVEMLLETRHLEKLTVHPLRDSFSDAIPVPVTLPSLRALAIVDDGSLYFLESLTLPMLEILEIHSDFYDALPQVLRMFDHSGCRLRSISMSDTSYDFSLAILEAIPTTRELHLCMEIEDSWWWERDLIPFFNRLATDAKFLPNLQTLSMEWDIRDIPQRLVEMLHEELVEMLESRYYQRNNHSTALKAFKLRLKSRYRSPTDNLEAHPGLIRDRMRLLAADGLNLELPVFSRNWRLS
ncbi:hypothetical protein B0H19DRAFT_692647 [Mycena capillaripes]|nr:hypothetical protein B0H19DRAFT_692647 [Mycena capillaripes]